MLGARGFSCAVSGFGQVLLSDHAEVSSACGRRNEGPRRTQEKTSGSQGKAFWSFFYIWFGFLCAPVSCAMGIASQGSLEKIAILTLKARSRGGPTT